MDGRQREEVSDVIARSSFLDIAPDPNAEGVRSVRGRVTETSQRGARSSEPTTVADLLAVIGPMGDLVALETVPVLEHPSELVGTSATRGFRKLLGGLGAISPETRALRRLLWDLPVELMVSGQSAMVDHPAIEPPTIIIPLSGVDQCAGWSAGGEMLTKIEAAGGTLQMDLSPTLVSADDELGDPSMGALPPMATRRRRVTTATGRDDVFEMVNRFRDSFADPDGIERALHEWTTVATFDSTTRALTSIEVSAGQLPWIECPSAAPSALRLLGCTPAEIGPTVGGSFLGPSTCTHLNDALRSLEDLPDLFDQLA